MRVGGFTKMAALLGKVAFFVFFRYTYIEYGEMRMSKLKLKNITKSYGEIKAVQDFNLELQEKSFIVLAGPSGCGKTTLLQLVAGFLTPDTGEIYIDNQLVNQKAPYERNISMVFQEAALFPHMSVYENITFGLAHNGMSQQDMDYEVIQICELLGIRDLLKRKAKELSGGQRQRCAIARALVRKPSLFLMDEPLSSLDARLKMQLRMEIAQLYQRNHATFLYVTHDQMEAMTLADTLVIMKDGKIQQLGNPVEIYHNPINLFTASFLGLYDINEFSARLEKGNLMIQEHMIPWTAEPVNSDVILAVRCEHIIEVRDDGILGHIMLVEQSGEQIYYHIQCKYGIVIMKGDVTCIYKRMDTIQFWFVWECAFLFDANTQSRIYKAV